MRKKQFSGLHYKCFTTVAYDHNDSSLDYKTVLLARAEGRLIQVNLALVKSVKIDHKVRCKLKRTYNHNYDCNTFIVQATGVNLIKNIVCVIAYLTV